MMLKGYEAYVCFLWVLQKVNKSNGDQVALQTPLFPSSLLRGLAMAPRGG